MKLAILLTGTIRPAVVGGNFSVKERLEMYTSTLDYYAKVIKKKYPIIFVENSDVDVSFWRKRYCDTLNLELLQFNPKERNDISFDVSKGKGYNEYLMIKYALKESGVIQNCSHFLKITGRYSMLNINTMIKEIEYRIEHKDIVFFGDIKDTIIYELIGRKTCSSHWGDSRFFVAQISFYNDYMSDCYIEMNDYICGSWAEDYLVRLSRKYRHDKRFIFRYRHRWRRRFSGLLQTLIY